MMGREFVAGLHFYQPPREATHPLLQKISTDPNNINWTSVITEQCYEPIALHGLLDKVSFDIYESLLLQLEKIDPKIASIYKDAMEKNGIGESFIHPILPDLPRNDKLIVIAAGANRFREITGHNPEIFWPPETAIDTETLEVLVENKYKGFVCAPEQIIQYDGRPSDNQPTVIVLPSGNHIIAYPFDRPISNKLAFDPKFNADAFRDMYISPRLNQAFEDKVLIAWTDAETFGHHYKDAVAFLDYLVNFSLPEISVTPTSINHLSLNQKKFPYGKIVEKSSWSCPHGNLIRWNGQCDCAYGIDASWKQPFTRAMSNLNDKVSCILDREIGSQYPSIVSQEFYKLYAHPELVKDPQTSLIAAKISSLIAKTSCATFFSTPEVSGKINLLYAYQTLLYLKDSGLTENAKNVENELFSMLSNVYYPNRNENALSVLFEMLGAQ